MVRRTGTVLRGQDGGGTLQDVSVSGDTCSQIDRVSARRSLSSRDRSWFSVTQANWFVLLLWVSAERPRDSSTVLDGGLFVYVSPTFFPGGSDGDPGGGEAEYKQNKYPPFKRLTSISLFVL